MNVIVGHADMAGTPMEIRLLNKAAPVVVGEAAQSGRNLDAVRTLLATEPSGLTPVCRQIREVIDKLKSMEAQLVATGKIALLIIVTDGESTDGVRPEPCPSTHAIERHPHPPLTRPSHSPPVPTTERGGHAEAVGGPAAAGYHPHVHGRGGGVGGTTRSPWPPPRPGTGTGSPLSATSFCLALSQYWHNINASLDLDMRVLDDVEAEAAEVVAQNPWLTYGEALHRAREFGVCVPAIDVLEERQLTKSEIKTVAEILLAPAGSARAALPPADGPWDTFVRGVATAQDALPLVYCPVKRQQRPWIDLQELASYTPDPVRIVLERNEELLWRIYLFYSYNAAVLADARAAAGTKGATPTKGLMDRLKPMPTFRSVFRYEKRLLHQDDLWAMLNDFSLVPSVINTIRYNKIIGEFSERRNALDKVQSLPPLVNPPS